MCSAQRSGVGQIATEGKEDTCIRGLEDGEPKPPRGSWVQSDERLDEPPNRPDSVARVSGIGMGAEVRQPTKTSREWEAGRCGLGDRARDAE